ncbi:MAG TPA: hypothetical protein VHC22_20975 [Pirellulales bacterium]|nr:hypothetical protein [Pirellulales bacterium]
MTVCRTIVDVPRDGAWNMAIDEVLLARATAEQRLQLRVYEWNVATVSLGYFQKVAERQQHPPSLGCPFVRRPSGGGAIVHDREVTYSLAVPAGREGDPGVLYRRVHTALVELLGRLGARAHLCETADQREKEPLLTDRPSIGPRGGSVPLLCFQRHSPGDVLLDGHKVIGSAQRRGQGAILQHGSVLLDTSPAAPELPGILNLAPVSLSRGEWSRHLQDALARAFDCTPVEKGLTEAEIGAAEHLVATKYGCDPWNRRR